MKEAFEEAKKAALHYKAVEQMSEQRSNIFDTPVRLDWDSMSTEEKKQYWLDIEWWT